MRGIGFSLLVLLATSLHAAAQHRWVQGGKDDEHRQYLYDGARQIGGYDTLTYTYFPLANRVWGPACEPPIAPPVHGVDRTKIAEVPRHSINGREVSQSAANDAVSAGVPDDSKALRVTVIGSPSEREPVGQLLRKSCKDGSCVIREYGPNDWETRAGFVTTGKPTTYVQAPDGKVLHRQDDPADVVEAVRKAKEGYDARKDPDLRKSAVPVPIPISIPSLSPVMLSLLGAGAYLVSRKRR